MLEPTPWRTLAEHIDVLWTQRICLMARPPADYPPEHMAIFKANGEPGRLAKAGEIDREFDDALKLMRELGIAEMRGRL